MKNSLTVFVVFLVFAVTGSAQTKKFESIYTSLSDKVCKTAELYVNEDGSYRGICPGIGGYRLELLEGDLRQTINVVAPNRKKSELNLWTIVSSGFFAVGAKAEWRVTRNGKKFVPLTLIIRFNTSKSPETPEQNNSFLAVIKITNNSACVTDVVEPGVQNQNVKARELADVSAAEPCKVSQ
ncbi:MAG: hypothetical protein ACR2GD_08765 [Pyrinomonadaceae bacterium]